MMSVIIIIGIIVLLGYGMHIAFKIADEKNREDTALLRKQQVQFIENKVTEKETTEEPEPEPLYQLQTDKVKYWLYSSSFKNLHELRFLYGLVVHQNLWINEPFHSKFYELLIIFDKNDFMIIDPNSKVITMNIRDKHNKTQASKSYQVYSTRDLIKFIIPECMKNIKRFNKIDAENILIAIFIFALGKSVHYLSSKVPKNTINELLTNYAYYEDIKYIVGLIEEKDSQLYFITEAFYEALSVVSTLPYNDSEVPKSLQIPRKLPEKSLQEI